MLKRLLTVAAVLALSAGTLQAVPVFVENHSFELPGEGKPGFDLIPAWSGEGSGGGGAETGWGPTDGIYTGFLGGNMEAYNLTGHVIATGEIFTLTVDARRTWVGPNITLGLYYDDGGARTQIASLFHEFVGGNTTDMEELVLVAVADDTPPAIGNNIGIQIISGDPDAAWIGFDNVRLDVVPEPATIALLGLGGLGLLRKTPASSLVSITLGT
jgi:hypothetical protein